MTACSYKEHIDKCFLFLGLSLNANSSDSWSMNVFAILHFAWSSKLSCLIGWRCLVCVCKRAVLDRVLKYCYVCCIPGWLLGFMYMDCTWLYQHYVGYCFLRYIWYIGHFESLLWSMWLVVILVTDLYLFYVQWHSHEKWLLALLCLFVCLHETYWFLPSEWFFLELHFKDL